MAAVGGGGGGSRRPPGARPHLYPSSRGVFFSSSYAFSIVGFSGNCTPCRPSSCRDGGTGSELGRRGGGARARRRLWPAPGSLLVPTSQSRLSSLAKSLRSLVWVLGAMRCSTRTSAELTGTATPSAASLAEPLGTAGRARSLCTCETRCRLAGEARSCRRPPPITGRSGQGARQGAGPTRTTSAMWGMAVWRHLGPWNAGRRRFRASGRLAGGDRSRGHRRRPHGAAELAASS